MDDNELFELVRKNYADVNKEYIQEQIKVAVYGRSRSGYYIYAPQLTIEQTA